MLFQGSYPLFIVHLFEYLWHVTVKGRPYSYVRHIQPIAVPSFSRSRVQSTYLFSVLANVESNDVLLTSLPVLLIRPK